MAQTDIDGQVFERRMNYRRPYLYPKQEAAIFDRARWSWIEATTKAGKTSGCVVWIGEEGFKCQEGQNCWWVAPTKPVSKIAYTRMVRAFEPGMIDTNETERRITLPNGAHIWFKGADDPDSLYGEDVYAAVLDECSRMKSESWYAVRTTLSATKGRARLIGNVKGRRNWFFHGCRKAESGEPNSAYHKITAEDSVNAGIMDSAEIDDARRTLPESVFKELYNAQASEDGGNPFGIDAIQSCVLAEFSKLPIASWGWDLGKRQDWTVGVALDRTGDMVKFVRFQLPWRETSARIVQETAGRPGLIDSTGVGDPVLENLQASGGNFEGYTFTSKSKQMLMEGLVVAIQQREIGLTDQVLINELEAFEYVYTRTGCRYSSPEGYHDDCVCALALAKQKLGVSGRPFVSSRVGRENTLVDSEVSMEIEDTRIRRGWEGRSLI